MNGASAVVDHPGGSALISWPADLPVRVEDSWYCPEFGIKIPNKALALAAHGAKCTFKFCIAAGTRDVSWDSSGAVAVDGKTYDA
jgi:hypothetical protein